MNKKLTILITVLALILLVSACTKKPIVNRNDANPIVTPSVSIDTSDWKTFRNERYGFEISFPGNLIYYNGTREINGNVDYIFNQEKTENVSFVDKKYLNKGVGVSSIEIKVKDFPDSIEQYQLINFPDCKSENVEVNNEKMVRVNCDGYADPIYYIAKKDSYVFQFYSNGDLKDDLTGMLETIKFVD